MCEHSIGVPSAWAPLSGAVQANSHASLLIRGIFFLHTLSRIVRYVLKSLQVAMEANLHMSKHLFFWISRRHPRKNRFHKSKPLGPPQGTLKEAVEADLHAYISQSYIYTSPTPSQVSIVKTVSPSQGTLVEAAEIAPHVDRITSPRPSQVSVNPCKPRAFRRARWRRRWRRTCCCTSSTRRPQTCRRSGPPCTACCASWGSPISTSAAGWSRSVFNYSRYTAVRLHMTHMLYAPYNIKFRPELAAKEVYAGRPPAPSWPRLLH